MNNCLVSRIGHLCESFENATPGGWIILIILAYLFFSLRKVYGQSTRKTILKVFLLFISHTTLIGITVILLVVYSALTL